MKLMNQKQRQFIDFEIVLRNGSKCSVRYFPSYLGGYEIETGRGERFYHRVDHFEYRGNRFISETLYLSHFIQVENDREIDYRGIALEIANEIADFEKEVNTQLALF